MWPMTVRSCQRPRAALRFARPMFHLPLRGGAEINKNTYKKHRAVGAVTCAGAC